MDVGIIGRALLLLLQFFIMQEKSSSKSPFDDPGPIDGHSRGVTWYDVLVVGGCC